MKIIAILHDVIEDTDVTAEGLLEYGIHQHFVDMVVVLTKVEGEDYFIDYLPRIKSKLEAKQVKIADILCNLGDSPTKKQVKKYSAALKYLLF